MSHSKTGNDVGNMVKSLVVTFFKFLFIVLAFLLRICGLILTKLAELLSKSSDHGNH